MKKEGLKKMWEILLGILGGVVIGVISSWMVEKFRDRAIIKNAVKKSLVALVKYWNEVKEDRNSDDQHIMSLIEQEETIITA